MPTVGPDGGTSAPTAAARALAKAIAGTPATTTPKPSAAVTLSRAVISGTLVKIGSDETTTVQLAGSATDTPAVVVAGYTPTPGDVVEVLVAGSRLVVLGPSSPQGAPAVQPFPFSFSGALATGTSPKASTRRDMTVTGLSITVGTPGSSAVTVQLLVNGTEEASVTTTGSFVRVAVPSLTIRGYDTSSSPDTFAFAITAAGGASDLYGELEIG